MGLLWKGGGTSGIFINQSTHFRIRVNVVLPKASTSTVGVSVVRERLFQLQCQVCYQGLVIFLMMCIQKVSLYCESNALCLLIRDLGTLIFTVSLHPSCNWIKGGRNLIEETRTKPPSKQKLQGTRRVSC